MLRICILTVSLLIFSLNNLWGQTSTEVYLFDLEKEGLTYTISNPVNISQNKGYDNQPSFLPDGSGVLFSSTRNGQTDVALYNIKDSSKVWLTHTEGSEYSPTVMPPGDHFSAIVLEEDGTQLLYKYPLEGGEREVIVDGLVVGYHTWFNKNILFSFVLGDPPTLQQSNLNNETNSVIADNPGRSLHSIPNSDLISFVDKTDSTSWTIKSVNPSSGKINPITPSLNNNTEDMAWTPGGLILMGEGPKLYANKPSEDTGWYEISDLSRYNLTGITRIAVGPKGKKIAIVVEE